MHTHTEYMHKRKQNTHSHRHKNVRKLTHINVYTDINVYTGMFGLRTFSSHSYKTGKGVYS